MLRRFVHWFRPPRVIPVLMLTAAALGAGVAWTIHPSAAPSVVIRAAADNSPVAGDQSTHTLAGALGTVATVNHRSPCLSHPALDPGSIYCPLLAQPAAVMPGYLRHGHGVFASTSPTPETIPGDWSPPVDQSTLLAYLDDYSVCTPYTGNAIAITDDFTRSFAATQAGPWPDMDDLTRTTAQCNLLSVLGSVTAAVSPRCNAIIARYVRKHSPGDVPALIPARPRACRTHPLFSPTALKAIEATARAEHLGLARTMTLVGPGSASESP